jgi:hypothetical protein
MYPLELCQEVSRALLIALGVALGAGCSSLLITWRLYRTTRYLKEALDRVQRSGSERLRTAIANFYRLSNERQKQLLESFLRAPVPTLQDLVNRTEEQYKLRRSTKPYGEEETIELRTKDLTRL